MPLLGASNQGNAATVVLALFHQVHDQLRKEIRGLDSNALNRVPVLGGNSVATILTHIVGSEDETFRCIAALPSVRDRDAEFAGSELTTAEALALLVGADELITTVKPHIDSDRLNSVFALPTLPAEELRSGLSWLVGNYGHACEHLGQIQLTRKLYHNERSPHS